MLPGVRATRAQVDEFATAWRHRNDGELAALSPEDRLFIALGDSLSQGIGATSLESTWVIRLARELESGGAGRVRVVNLSVSGGRIGDVLATQLPRLEAIGVRPAVVTCTVGSNDLIGSPRFGRAVDEMRMLLGELPSGAVMATIPDRGSLVAKAFNRRLRHAVAEHPVRLADIAPLAYRGRKTYAPDWFHPNDRGYEAWFATFAAVLTEES